MSADVLTLDDYRPRARWTPSATNYTGSFSRGQQPRARQSSPDDYRADVSSVLAPSDLFLIRQGVRDAERVTSSWHRVKVAGACGDEWKVRLVVLYWGRYDVARRVGITANCTRQLWAHLHALGVVSDRAWIDDDAYNAWCMLGEVAS